MAEQDPQLDLKKRARRRLVGAAALALLAAIVLPLVMDQEPKPVGQDIQIRIPSQNAPGTPLLADKPGAAPSPVSAPVEPAPAPVAGAAPAVPAAVAAPVPVPAKAEDKPKPVAKAEAESKLANGAAPAQAAPSDQARAEAILNGVEAAGQTGAASGKFVVQLGVFADSGNVKKLRERIKGQGYNSFTEDIKTDKGVKIRVRAGPFPNKEAALKARDRLKHHTGIDGIVADK